MSRYRDSRPRIPLADVSIRDMERMERDAFSRSLMVREADGCSECQGWKRLPCSYCGLGESHA